MFLDKSLTVYLGVNDIFNGQIYKGKYIQRQCDDAVKCQQSRSKCGVDNPLQFPTPQRAATKEQEPDRQRKIDFN